MRVYVAEHQTEFMPEGVEVVLPEPTPDAAPKSPGITESLSDKTREKERHQRGLQWAWDTFAGASQVAKQSTKTLLELLHDGWVNSTSTSILFVVILGLVISNVWTYMSMGSAVDSRRRKEKELAKVEDKEQWVAGVVTHLWDELAAGKLAVAPAASTPEAPPLPLISPSVPPSPENLKLELVALQTTLDTIEDRVRLVRESLGELQSLNNMD
jgi:hypothetical protein